MKKIILQVPSHVYAENKIFEKIGTPNNTLDSWYRLKHRLADMGYLLTTADQNDLNDCHAIIFHDASSLDPSFKTKGWIKYLASMRRGQRDVYPTRKLYDEAEKAGLRNKMILLIYEGETNCPLNFSEKIWKKFDHILTWDDDLSKKDEKFKKYHMPMESSISLPPTIPFSQKKLLVNISYNKYASYKSELYSARRETISFFDSNYPNDFDLFGIRWNKPITRLQKTFPILVKKYRTYRGRAEYKLETLCRYKFNLCYENDSGANDRITEKIFNAIKAGTVPIYWGASRIQEYVDPDVFIDRRTFKTNRELSEFLVHMQESEYQTYINAAQRYMKSEKFSRFLPDSFCDRMIEILSEIKIIN